LKPDERFVRQPRHFWAYVRTVGQELGYTKRKTKSNKTPTLKVYTLDDIRKALRSLGLHEDHLIQNGSPTDFANTLTAYVEYRAEVLNGPVQEYLMDASRAKEEFLRLKDRLKPTRPVPMNKQKGEKKAPAYLTGLVNMTIEANAQGFTCDFDPQAVTTVTRDGAPLRTLARRVDGAFPSTVNPIALWEIKEYYYTTTFGSRIADGVYESLLDGMELEELRDHEDVTVLHYLIIDGRRAWWNDGRAYLCRIIDMLHMGYLDEALFGAEVLDRLPAIVSEWVELARSRPPEVAGAGPDEPTPSATLF
jgi:hypothetical protein